MVSIREKHIASMTPRTGNVKPVYRLRWAFHFSDGRVKYGVWNGSTNNFNDTAAAVNKTGLILAQIQREDFCGGGIQALYECDGHDYVTSKWIGAVSGGAVVGKWNVKSVKRAPDIIGLAFLTRKERVCVLVDGTIQRRPHRVDEKIENIREHSLEG